jgi:hypothetical protein
MKKSFLLIGALISFLFLNASKGKFEEIGVEKKRVLKLLSQKRNLERQLYSFRRLKGEESLHLSPEVYATRIMRESFFYNCSFSYNPTRKKDGNLSYLDGVLKCKVPDFVSTKGATSFLEKFPIVISELSYKNGVAILKLKVYGEE